MKIWTSILFSISLLISHAALAHSEHAHSLSANETAALGVEIARKLAVEDLSLPVGQLPSSWLDIPESHASIFKEGKGYLIVSVLNKVEDKTLFILMSASGEVYDVNFSGAFPKLR